MATAKRPTVKNLSDELDQLTAWTERQVDRIYDETGHLSADIQVVCDGQYRLETWAIVFAAVLYYLGYVLFAQILWG